MYVPIVHRFCDMARRWSKIANLNLPHRGDLVGISRSFLATKNKSRWAIVWRRLRNPAFSRFGTVPACDKRRDGWMDRHDDSIFRASTKWRGKINMLNTP